MSLRALLLIRVNGSDGSDRKLATRSSRLIAGAHEVVEVLAECAYKPFRSNDT